MLNLKFQYLSYSIVLRDVNDKEVLTYADSHFGNNGIIRISDEVFRDPNPSKVIETFNILDNVENPVYVSSAVDAEPGTNNNEALHTIAVYSNGYEGDVIVQATLENQITNTTEWADIVTLSFDGSIDIEPVPASFNGVLRFIRIKTTQDPTDRITKVLVRN
jgi:hypothetical protein